jgi:hypothetical protein
VIYMYPYLFLISCPLFVMCLEIVPYVTNIVLKAKFIFFRYKGRRLCPATSPVRCSPRYRLHLPRVRIRSELWTARNEDRTWDGTEDGSAGLRTRSGTGSESGTITSSENGANTQIWCANMRSLLGLWNSICL